MAGRGRTISEIAECWGYRVSTVSRERVGPNSARHPFTKPLCGLRGAGSARPSWRVSGRSGAEKAGEAAQRHGGDRGKLGDPAGCGRWCCEAFAALAPSRSRGGCPRCPEPAGASGATKRLTGRCMCRRGNWRAEVTAQVFACAQAGPTKPQSRATRLTGPGSKTVGSVDCHISTRPAEANDGRPRAREGYPIGDQNASAIVDPGAKTRASLRMLGRATPTATTAAKPYDTLRRLARECPATAAGRDGTRQRDGPTSHIYKTVATAARSNSETQTSPWSGAATKTPTAKCFGK